MGVLFNAAYSDVTTRTEGIQLYRMNRIEGAGYPGAPDVVYFPAIVRGLDNIYDRERDEVLYGRVPAGAVVVPGTLPSSTGNCNLYAAIIVKRVDAKTRAKTSINELLRED